MSINAKNLIAVCGPGDSATLDLENLAEEVGREIARRGFGVVCGGRRGVMEGACRGAKAEGGLTVGILPGYNRKDANPYVDVIICSGMGEARNTLIAATGSALIAVGGEWGTLSEMALALKIGRPVVTLAGWGWDVRRVSEHDAVSGQILAASTPQEAVALACEQLKPEA